MREVWPTFVGAFGPVSSLQDMSECHSGEVCKVIYGMMCHGHDFFWILIFILKPLTWSCNRSLCLLQWVSDRFDCYRQCVRRCSVGLPVVSPTFFLFRRYFSLFLLLYSYINIWCLSVNHPISSWWDFASALSWSIWRRYWSIGWYLIHSSNMSPSSMEHSWGGTVSWIFGMIQSQE